MLTFHDNELSATVEQDRLSLLLLPYTGKPGCNGVTYRDVSMRIDERKEENVKVRWHQP